MQLIFWETRVNGERRLAKTRYELSCLPGDNTVIRRKIQFKDSFSLLTMTLRGEV